MYFEACAIRATKAETPRLSGASTFEAALVPSRCCNNFREGNAGEYWPNQTNLVPVVDEYSARIYMQIKIEHKYIGWRNKQNRAHPLRHNKQISSEPMMMWNNALTKTNTSEDIEEAEYGDQQFRSSRACVVQGVFPSEADPEPASVGCTLRVCTCGW
jgi:hypothetical protein